MSKSHKALKVQEKLEIIYKSKELIQEAITILEILADSMPNPKYYRFYMINVLGLVVESWNESGLSLESWEAEIKKQAKGLNENSGSND